MINNFVSDILKISNLKSLILVDCICTCALKNNVLLINKLGLVNIYLSFQLNHDIFPNLTKLFLYQGSRKIDIEKLLNLKKLYISSDLEMVNENIKKLLLSKFTSYKYQYIKS